jgi:DNA helicase-2/ATP-dependent DNA helicase PcrA
VATELQRIRGFFDRIREPEGAAPTGSEAPAGAPPEPQDANAFPAGTRVRSARFGSGTVLAASGSGDGLTYTIRFDHGGDKRILARFGGLQRG